MTSENYPQVLHQGRGWLNRAAEMLDSCEDHVSDAEFARAAAAIGSGFIALAQAQMSAPVSMRLTSEMPPALISAVERAGRAEAEARPHDDELVPCDQPDGIANDSHDLPGPARAAERVNAFLAWWGDGQIGEGVLGVGPPLFARDLQALTNAAVDRG